MLPSNDHPIVLRVPSSSARQAKEALRILGVQTYAVTSKDGERIYEGYQNEVTI